MQEIKSQGPVQAVMQVYTDLFMYSSGIYRVTSHGQDRLAGYHAVRIVGWGEENGVRYWTVANSWGTNWGEAGHFRIVRGVNECMIESFVIGAWTGRIKPRESRSRSHSRQRHHSRVRQRPRHHRRPHHRHSERHRHHKNSRHSGKSKGYFQVG